MKLNMSNDYKDSFRNMKRAGSLAAQTLDEITKYIKPGISTEKIFIITYLF